MKKLSSGSFSLKRSQVVSKEIAILLDKTAIAEVTPSEDQFVSPIFDVAKKESEKRRVILNLKELNQFALN